MKGPFIKDSNSTHKMMKNLLIALIPIILFSFYKNGIMPFINNKTNFLGLIYPLIFILIPSITTFLVEFLYAKIILHKKNKELKDYVLNSFSIFPGLFLGLILPLNIPISIVIIGSLFATIIGKLVYGGFGNNIFNPALIGYIFIVASYSIFFSSSTYFNKLELDTISGATPLTNASMIESIGSYEELVEPYGTLSNFFFGFIPGAVGETSAFLCIVALIYLCITKTIKWQIPVIYIGTVFIMTALIGFMNNQGIYYPLFQIFSGGLMFGAVFMATDPVTSPTTKPAIVLSSLTLGILTVYLRYNGIFPEGVATSILTVNMLTFIFEKMGIKIRFDIKKIVLPLIILLLLMGLTIFKINKSFNNTSEIDSNFNIIKKEINDNVTSYTVTQKGYVGDIKALIEFKDHTLVKFEILEQNESFYSKIEEDNYINKLISDINNIEEVDTVSGATITSNAIKKLLINVISDYEKGGHNVSSSNNSVKVENKNFEIIETNVIDNVTEYIVSQKSFSGKIKAKVSVSEKEIVLFEILEINDSYKDKVLNTDYINNLINNQNSLEEVDTISGATVTSNAIKNIFSEIMVTINE